MRSILASLEAFEEEEIDWDALIGDHHYFDGIRACTFPPFYNVSNFEFLDHFLFDERYPEIETTCATFKEFDLYLKAGTEQTVLEEFTRFIEHLKNLKVLQDAGLV